MKRLLTISLLAATLALPASAQRFRHVEILPSMAEPVVESMETAEALDNTPRDLEQILADLDSLPLPKTFYNPYLLPRVFMGYRHIGLKKPSLPEMKYTGPVINGNLPFDTIPMPEVVEIEIDEDGEIFPLPDPAMDPVDLTQFSVLPQWMRDALTANRLSTQYIQSAMVAQPSSIQYAYWDLPEPPRLPDEDYSFAAFLKRHQLPPIQREENMIPVVEGRKRHWLHNLNAALQFSQAYLSPNWYQGGNNHLALLVNFYWNVTLNTVYHPNLLFESTLSYKLGLNSVKDDPYHKYSISEDLFQWNAKAGVKAFSHWFYSLNVQFKTQLLNNYPSLSLERKAAFLSPADLNVGLGMTYTKSGSNYKFNASIGAISYNLRTCIDTEVDPTQFNILPGHKTRSEIGSNSEVTLEWAISSNIDLRSRLFLFTDYRNFQGDLENTLNFSINRFLSTQIYVHLRYDTSAPSDSGWKRWQLKEILSFGISYSFSTK